MEFSAAQKKYFTQKLMDWHRLENFRSLPWKLEKDPYKIWLSEIILQQTRAEQGLPYYLAFTEKYPTIAHLADANDEEVFRLWQGLGYYNRCKNLLTTARKLATAYAGKFPATYDEVLALKGIGPYTAAAITSFAFGLPHAVVDGNVYRVLARYFGIDTPFDSNAGKKLFQTLSQELLDRTDSASYNQAIMDLGATVCKPSAPLCSECPLQKKCFALKHLLTDSLPVKSKKIKVKERHFHYILLRYKDRLWVRKRTGQDIWQNLYEPFLIETEYPLDKTGIEQHPLISTLNSLAPLEYLGSSSQKLTHQLIHARFYTVELPKQITIPQAKGEWVILNMLKNLPFPKTLVSFLEKNFYF